jgi:hypothetical protein
MKIAAPLAVIAAGAAIHHSTKSRSLGFKRDRADCQESADQPDQRVVPEFHQG